MCRQMLCLTNLNSLQSLSQRLGDVRSFKMTHFPSRTDNIQNQSSLQRNAEFVAYNAKSYGQKSQLNAIQVNKKDTQIFHGIWNCVKFQIFQLIFTLYVLLMRIQSLHIEVLFR